MLLANLLFGPFFSSVFSPFFRRKIMLLNRPPEFRVLRGQQQGEIGGGENALVCPSLFPVTWDKGAIFSTGSEDVGLNSACLCCK